MRPEVARCHLIVSVLAADGMMPKVERALLHRIMKQLELTPEEREQIANFEGASDALTAAQSLPAEERQAIADAIVEAALADGKLSPQETAAVKRITAALDL